jgi:hypothetical protein
MSYRDKDARVVWRQKLYPTPYCTGEMVYQPDTPTFLDVGFSHHCSECYEIRIDDKPYPRLVVITCDGEEG